MTHDEELLPGGNMNSVARHGKAIHRTAGPWTSTVHRLLEHLNSHGLSWAPVPLGFDEQGREIVTYLGGTVPNDPMPSWVWKDAVLVSAASHLAALHDVTSAYQDPRAVWRLPTHQPVEVICHNDFAPYNMVFDHDRQLVGVIDWDTASPGPRIWDLAYLAYRLVPLSAPTNVDGLGSPIWERRRRLDLACDSYGKNRTSVAVAEAAIERLSDLAEFTASRAADGAEHVAAHVQLYKDDATWLRTNLARFRD